MAKIQDKFIGEFADLQSLVFVTGIFRDWEDQGNKKIFRSETGGVLVWYESTKTIYFQGGPKSYLAREFFKMAALYGGEMGADTVRPCKTRTAPAVDVEPSN